MSFSLFTVFIPRSTKKAKQKKIHIFRSPITLRAANFYFSYCVEFVSIMVEACCWLEIRVLSFSILIRALFVSLTDSTFPNNKLIHHINQFAFASRLA
jgi:hypothetical protein